MLRQIRYRQERHVWNLNNCVFSIGFIDLKCFVLGANYNNLFLCQINGKFLLGKWQIHERSSLTKPRWIVELSKRGTHLSRAKSVILTHCIPGFYLSQVMTGRGHLCKDNRNHHQMRYGHKVRA